MDLAAAAASIGHQYQWLVVVVLPPPAASASAHLHPHMRRRPAYGGSARPDPVLTRETSATCATCCSSAFPTAAGLPIIIILRRAEPFASWPRPRQSTFSPCELCNPLACRAHGVAVSTPSRKGPVVAWPRVTS